MSLNTENIEAKNMNEIERISTEILKSMLKRSYPQVDGLHYFRKYAIDGKPNHQFIHALGMMSEGGLIRIDKQSKPYLSVTFTLMEDNKVKLHHMIDDEYNSDTFGCMMLDPVEAVGDLKKISTCYKHLESGYTNGCDKCELERNSRICLTHGEILFSCVQCKKSTQEIKKTIAVHDKDKFITAVLKEYKKQYWSFEN